MKALLLLFPVSLLAQPVIVPNGLIYQSAAANGISYISPVAGTQVLDQRAAINWKSLVNSAAGTGTITAVIMGVTKVIAMSSPWTVGLGLAHSAWDSFGSGVLQEAQPNPKAIIASLLQPSQSTMINGTCSESSMFATTSKSMKPIGPLNVGGAGVTFSPQGLAVLVNAAGSKIKGFAIYDVLVCPWVAPASSREQLSFPTVELDQSPVKVMDISYAPDQPLTDPTPEQLEMMLRIYLAHQKALEAIQ
jgi:hypothetical protein